MITISNELQALNQQMVLSLCWRRLISQMIILSFNFSLSSSIVQPCFTDKYIGQTVIWWNRRTTVDFAGFYIWISWVSEVIFAKISYWYHFLSKSLLSYSHQLKVDIITDDFHWPRLPWSSSSGTLLMNVSKVARSWPLLIAVEVCEPTKRQSDT